MHSSFFLFEKLCSSNLTAMFNVQSEVTNINCTICIIVICVFSYREYQQKDTDTTLHYTEAQLLRSKLS